MLLLLLVAVAGASTSFSRNEFLLEFHVSASSSHPFAAREVNTGPANSQVHVTTATPKRLCYSWLEDSTSAAASLSARASSFPNGTFAVQVNATFPNGVLVFALSDTGVYTFNAEAGVFYGAIALGVTGGTGAFAGARGSGCYISYGFAALPGRFQILLRAVYYVPHAPAVGGPHPRRSADDCVNPSFPSPNGLTWGSLALTFDTVSSGNVNKGRAAPQVLASSAATGTSQRYDLNPAAAFRYDSVVGQPSPLTFNETGTLSCDAGVLHFTSAADGHVQTFCPADGAPCITHGSIAYRIDRASGLLGAGGSVFGMMVDVFEDAPNATSFSIHAVAVLFRLP